jgi:hypothetical protein
MSQGHKQPPEPALFVDAADVYRHIPTGHFYERLAKLLELEFVYELTRPLYAEKIGRPSLDPVVFFKCMLAGFFEEHRRQSIIDGQRERSTTDQLNNRFDAGSESGSTFYPQRYSFGSKRNPWKNFRCSGERPFRNSCG